MPGDWDEFVLEVCERVGVGQLAADAQAEQDRGVRKRPVKSVCVVEAGRPAKQSAVSAAGRHATTQARRKSTGRPHPRTERNPLQMGLVECSRSDGGRREVRAMKAGGRGTGALGTPRRGSAFGRHASAGLWCVVGGFVAVGRRPGLLRAEAQHVRRDGSRAAALRVA